MDHGRSDGGKGVIVTEFDFLVQNMRPVFERHGESVPTLTETVSFSFTIGTTPMKSSSLIVFTALRYLVR
jgi:hypothetical protein